ncbi:hypothetical protein P7K49_024694, partial [Saguinus oedipus]
MCEVQESVSVMRCVSLKVTECPAYSKTWTQQHENSCDGAVTWPVASLEAQKRRGKQPWETVSHTCDWQKLQSDNEK